VHVVPPQHACPAPPHAHVPDEQVRFAPHMLPAQQSCETAPHGAHVPLVLHAKPLLHVVPEQHGCPFAPHAHVPDAHTRFAPHVVPQHGCPFAPPHGLHIAVTHVNPTAHVPPGQHACDAAPQLPQPAHGWHVLVAVSHESPTAHELFGQHALPVEPHGVHTLLTQMAPI
jgi:hypothetical protein